MPLYTQLTDTAGRTRKIPWSWEDKCILDTFVEREGGTEELDRTGEFTFTETFGYCQVDTRTSITIRPGAKYKKWYSHL